MADDGTTDNNATDDQQAPNPLRLPLSKPVKSEGNMLEELVFREPTAADIEAVGNPVILDVLDRDVPKINFDARAMSAMMARLASVPPSTIRQLTARDWNTGAWRLVGFFTPVM
jgi:hypothetical protein